MRISLGELMVLVALVAVAIVTLKYANDTWLAAVAAIAMLLLFAAVIIAVLDRGPRQAFAIGFAIVAIFYGLVVVNGEKYSRSDRRNNEFDFGLGRLPTTRLLRYAHAAIENSQWIDHATGKAVPDYDPHAWNAAHAGNPNQLVVNIGVYHQERPPRDVFMPIGHVWWMLLLGYAGGHFARFVYWRRFRDEQKIPADTS